MSTDADCHADCHADAEVDQTPESQNVDHGGDGPRQSPKRHRRRRRSPTVDADKRLGLIIAWAATAAIRRASERGGGEGFDADEALGRTYGDVRGAASSALDGLVLLVRRALHAVVLLAALFASALSTYAVVYLAAMPPHGIREPAYFDYNFRPERHRTGPYARLLEKWEALEEESGKPAVPIDEEEDSCTDGEGASFDGDEQPRDACADSRRAFSDARDGGDPSAGRRELYAASDGPIGGGGGGPLPPTAVVDLLGAHTQWTARVGDVLPPASRRPPERALRPRRRYRVEVSLSLPESDVNRRLGVFMVEVDLLSSDGTVLASSDRPAMLPYESPLVGLARRAALLGPILIGAIPEARTVAVNCVDNFVESAERPLASVVLRLVAPPPPTTTTTTNRRPDGDRRGYRPPPRSRPVQVLGAEVRVGKELNAAQRTMKEWFYTCGAVGTLVIMLIYSLLWFVAMAARRRGRERAFRGQYHRHGHRRNRHRDDDGGGSEPRHLEGAFPRGLRSASFQQGKVTGSGDCDLGCTDCELDGEYDLDEWEGTDNHSNEMETGERVETLPPNKEAGGGDKEDCHDFDAAIFPPGDRLPDRGETAHAVCDTNRNAEASRENGSPKVKRKEKTVSADKAELRVEGNSSRAELSTKLRHKEERSLAEKVMKGDIFPYEIFTGETDP